MRQVRVILSLALFLCVSSTYAAPPKVPGARTVAVGEVFEVEFEEDLAGPAIVDNPYPLDTVFIREAKPSRAKTVAYIIQPKKPGTYRLTLWTKGDTVGDRLPVAYYEFIVSGTVPQPGPSPTPKPDDPPLPAPKGFRVIFVYESANPLSPNMQNVMFGEKTRTYLDSKTVANPQVGKGWRRYDKDVDAANERDVEIKALWQATQSKVTTVPCVIIAVDGKAVIEPFPESEDAALTLFKKYGGQ